MNLYEKAHSKVRVNSVLSEDIDSMYGVLQGGVLSPKLFNTFLSDINQYLDPDDGVNIYGMPVAYLLYADDLVLLATSPEDLQKQLDRLFQYCRKWHLIVNMDKSNIMIFNNKKGNNRENFTYGDKSMERVDSYKYLGYLLTSSHKDIFYDAYGQLCDKGRKAVYQSYSCCYQHIGKPNPRLSLKLFDSQIRPCLDYGCEIWGMNKSRNIDKFETIHLRYLKAMLGVRKQTTTAAVYADTGRVPLKAQWETRALKYWERVVNLKDSHILHRCYMKLYCLERTGQDNWCTNIRHLLNSLGARYSQLWNNQELPIDHKTISNATEPIHNKYRVKIMNEISLAGEGNKLRTYKTFKSEFRLEHYLFSVKNQNYRTALAQYRLSSHNLGIEIGRHCRPPKPPCDRICLYCSIGAIDDEVHFLTTCEFHNEPRTTFESYLNGKILNYHNKSDMDKFILVMKETDTGIINALAKFVYTAFKQRQQL